MYPQGPYFGLAPSYYGFVGFTPVAMPPPMGSAVPTVPVPVVTTTTLPAVTEPEPVQYVREKPPVTTVFVGNIAEVAPDQLIKTLLMRCGNILSWKRVQGASGKLQAFGFCEYEDPESTMRCVRLLNGFKVGPKPLLVKVDPKTEDLLNEYRKKKEQSGEEGTLGATSEEIDSSTLRDDEAVKAALEGILKENATVLDGSPRKQDSYLEGPRHLTIEDMDLDSDRKDLINREIEIFRKRNEKEDQNDSANRRPKKRNSDRPNLSLQLYSSYSENDRREHDQHKDKTRRSRSRSVEKPKRVRGKSQTVDEEEEMIRKKLERKLREKEESYQKRLKQWEARERKRANEYEHERDHERKRQRELQVEAQRLREFFEDYNDDVEDPKYYRGSAFHQRLKDREIEEAADERDRQKEIEQIDEARRKLIEEGDPNAESIILQMEQKMQEHLRKRLKLDGTAQSCTSDSPKDELDQLPPESNAQTLAYVSNDQEETKSTKSAAESPRDNQQWQSQDQTSEFVETAVDETSVGLSRDGSSTFLFAMNSAESVVRKKAAAFSEDEPEDIPKKHLPSWLPPAAFKSGSTSSNAKCSNSQSDANDNTSNAAIVATFTAEEKKAIVKRIIDGIPTGRRELFNYAIDWDMVDRNFIITRIKPWVDKKIVSYIGEAEATLSDFICDQLLHHKPPERVLSDIAMVLDEEAEVFVVKMWRLLIYLIAEKKAGLSS